MEELRDRGTDHRHVRVDVAATATAGWRAVPGAEIVEHATARGIVVALRDGVDPGRGARRRPRGRARSRYFSLERPTLTDLFREAVAA